MKILLVDDSVLMLDRLQEMLSNYPQLEVVASFKNGNTFLEAIQQYKPHLAIFDLRMLGPKSLETLKNLRKENLNISIIILAFFATAHFRLAAMLAGADYFFSKVNDYEKVEQVVLSLLQEEELNQKLRLKEMKALRLGFHKNNLSLEKQLQSKSS